MRFFRTLSTISLIFGIGILQSACGSQTKGWSASGGKGVSRPHLAAISEKCGYRKSREKAMDLLAAGGNKRRNERRAGQVLETAQNCMRKHGLSHRIGSLAH